MACSHAYKESRDSFAKGERDTYEFQQQAELELNANSQKYIGGV